MRRDGLNRGCKKFHSKKSYYNNTVINNNSSYIDIVTNCFLAGRRI